MRADHMPKPSDEPNLLPCPFCGSKAERDSGWGGYVRCTNITDDSGGCIMAVDWIAEKSWNRRVPANA